MKTIQNRLIWITFALLLALGSCLTACKTTTPAGTAFLTLKDTQIAVDKAMTVYGNQCALGKVSVQKQTEIDRVHYQYRIGFRAAVNLARMDYSKLTPESVLQLSNELLLLISQL